MNQAETQENPAETTEIPAEAAAEPAPENALEKAGEEIASLKDRLLRAVAETENVRKRGERDREETAKYAIAGFARDLINVGENLKRALDNTPPEARAGNELITALATGVEMTLTELLSIFERHGIRRVDPLGQKFDHNFHQAVAQVETADAEAGTVVQVMQAGYVIHDRLLRPAMVAVAKAATGEPPRQVDTTA